MNTESFPILAKLQTQAQTTSPGGGNQKYDVTLRKDLVYGTGVILCIEGTGGHWSLRSLNVSGPEGLYIDMGQEWICTNIQDILCEANVSIPKKDFYESQRTY